ncbi:MAG: iron-containing redox enzyme family protein [Chloroflexia bacterium]|nr:iron-containing redox enzyme family protein [Chloroflexia bacterium]
MQALKHNMGIKDEQMSFYLQHVKIDQKHGKDIQNMVTKVCETNEHWEAIKEVAKTSLWLMFRMVQDILEEYEKLAKGESVKFKIVNHIEH